MKKILLIILAVALIGIWFGATLGFKTVKITPINYVQCMYRDLPEHFKLVQEFTEFYGEGDPQTIGEKLFWYYENMVNALTFPVKASYWCINVALVVIKNIPELVDFDVPGSPDIPAETV